MNKAFLICPVRGHNMDETRKYVEKLESEGWTVHWPPRDTDQSDPIGLNICLTNLDAIEESDQVFLVYDPTSLGSHFDMGMAFALRKRLVILSAPPPDAEGKSFLRMIRAWAGW
jgi:hypothetical protein